MFGKNASISRQGMFVFCCILVDGTDKMVLKPACTLGTCRIILKMMNMKILNDVFRKYRKYELGDTEIKESRNDWESSFHRMSQVKQAREAEKQE